MIYYAAWNELHKDEFCLSDILQWVQERPKETIFEYRSLHIYIFKEDDIYGGSPIIRYVGKTEQGFLKRYRQHLRKRTDIGRAIQQSSSRCWYVQLIEIDKNLDIAERYYIERFKPGYNAIYNRPLEDDFELDVADIYELKNEGVDD